MFRSIARTYQAAFSGLPRDVWLLSAAVLVNRAGTMVLPFISLYLTQQRGFEITTAGRILSLYGIGSAIGSYLGGWVSDKIGTDRAMFASLVSSGFAFLWLGWQTDPWAITGGVFLLSVLSESFRPMCMAATAQRSPARLRVRAFALLRLAANLGVGIGPAVGGVLALYDYRALFLVDAATCWAAALIVLRLPKPGPESPDTASDTSGRAGSPWKDGPFLCLLLLVMLLALSFFQIFSTLPLYFREIYHFREDTIGLLLALNALIIVLFEMVLIHHAERHDRMFLVGIGSFLVCFGFALMPLGSGVIYAAFTVAVWTLGEMLALPLMNAVVADRAGSANRGRYMGLYTMAFSVAFIVAPAAGTWVYERLGPDALWYLVGILGLPLFAGAWGLRVSLGKTRNSG